MQKCQEFTSLDVAAGVHLVKQKRLCFNCLQLSHMINQCASKSVCRTCCGKHHSLIHRERLSNKIAHVAMAQSSEVDNSNQSAIVSNEIAQSNLGINGNSQVIQATALVSLEKLGSHEQIKCRAFLDPGAQSSCITEQCVQAVGLAKERSLMQIFGIGAPGSTLSKNKVSFNLLGDDRVIPVEAFVLEKVTKKLPCAPLDPKALQRSKRLKLADPKFYQPGPIDIVIGNDVYESLMMAGKIEDTEVLFYRESVFRWLVTGKYASSFALPGEAVPMHAQVLQPDVNDQPRKIWEIQEVPYASVLTEEEKECERHFFETTTRQEDGRYVVSLPFKPDSKSLGHSLPKALNRLNSLEQKFQQEGNLKQRYTAFIQEFLDMQHMTVKTEEEVPVEPSKSFYLPHHAVMKELSTTTKLKVVFDGSALTTNGNTVSGNFTVGAKQQDDIFGILLRFQLRAVSRC